MLHQITKFDGDTLDLEMIVENFATSMLMVDETTEIKERVGVITEVTSHV